MGQEMLLRKQKNNTILGIDVNTVIKNSIFTKIVKRIELTKSEKEKLKDNLGKLSKTTDYIKKEYNSIYFFQSINITDKYYYKKKLEKIFSNFHIKYDKIIMCKNELVEALREFRVDVVVTPTENVICSNENLLTITTQLAERRKNSRLNSRKYNETTLEKLISKNNAFIDCISDYTQVVYIGENKYNLENTDKVQFISNYYELAYAVNRAKINIENRKRDIFKSYEMIPKTGNPTFDKEYTKYWLACKFEGNEYDKHLQRMSRFDFVMFHNRYNMNDTMYFYEPFNVSYTYNDIKKMVNKTIEEFQKMGIKKGDVVALCLPNCIQDVVSSFALNHMGVVINAIHPLATIDKIENFFAKTNPKYFIYMDMPKAVDQVDPISLDKLIEKYNIQGVIEVSLVEDANTVVKTLLNTKTMLEKSKDENSRRYKLEDTSKLTKWKDVVKNYKKFNKEVTVDKHNQNDTSFYYSTGGTSAESSKVVQLPRFFDNIAYYNSYGISIEKGQVAFSNYPSYIAFSDGNCRHQPSSVGLMTILSPKDYPENFAEKLESTKATVLQVAPQFFRLMLDAEKRGEFDGIDLSNFKYVVAGGDKIDNKLKIEVLEFFARHNNTHVHFFVGCGCTELGGSTIVQLFETGNTLEEKNIGVPLPVFELKIVDDDKKELVNGEKQGELLIGIRGIDNIGYANEQKMSSQVFEKIGDTIWYNTEDVVSFSEEQLGTIDFISRNKRFIMITEDDRSGKLIPDDIELQIISNVPEVDTCCVVGVDENNSTKLKAVVRIKKDIEVTDDLNERIKKAACKKDIIARLDEIVFMEELPLTDRQKIKYREIEKMFEERNKSKKVQL